MCRESPRRRWSLLALLVSACAAIPQRPGSSAPPLAPPTPLDCANWRYGAADEPAPGELPTEYDRDNYKRTSLRDTRPELANSPQNLCGQKGSAVDLAWGLTKGRDDVLIAVLDSGIMWRRRRPHARPRRPPRTSTSARPSLACAAAGGDCNGDGRFDIADFGALDDRNGNGLADPEDLILDPAYSNGRDDDRNGYVDDISGWDFLYGDNNPLDTVEYGHGTGEADDSTARENGTGDVGNCPQCRMLPGASVGLVHRGGREVRRRRAVRARLRRRRHPGGTGRARRTRSRRSQAIDAAYERGVVVVASMADEASKHPNLPSSLEHTMAVNSVTEKEDVLTGESTGWLALNGCTNFGGRTFVTVPSGSCSSEATGQSAGMIGLLESAARDAGIEPHRDLRRYRGAGTNVLSAERSHADRPQHRRRHRLLDAERSRSRQQLRNVHRRARRHRAVPDNGRLGRDLRLRPGQQPTR